MKKNIIVKTNSKETKIESVDDKTLKVWLKSLPIENKANQELTKVLKKFYKKDVKILKGFSSKNKLVEIEDGN